MTKIKRVFGRILRQPAKLLRILDRKIQRGFTKIFRGLYKIKFLRPVTKKTYRFIHYHHRISASLLLLLLLVGAGIPIVQPYIRAQRYTLNKQTQGLLGVADKDLTKKLSFDEKTQVFQFNKDAKKPPTTEGNPLENLKSQIGGGGAKDNQLYSVDVSKDLSKGVTYYDNQMGLSFKLTPQFKTMPGEQKEGHLIYPLSGVKGQLAYTVDASGLKENVVLNKSPGDTFTMEYTLNLPKSLEARLIPETGEIGIYSADPALFGNISYGSSDDQMKVENARNNSEKNYLTFKIPAPVVIGAGNTNQKSIAAVDSHFELSGNTLRVVTKGLDKAQYPLSIDPSVTVDSNSDFQSGNMEDNNFSVSGGDLKRGNVTGGGVGNFNPTTNLQYGLATHSAVAYNGYIYVTGGWDGGQTTTDVRYASLNSSTGAVGSWSVGTSFTVSRGGHVSLVYNGYLYLVGGWNSATSSVLNDVWYAPINTSTGALGTWQQTTGFSTGREFHSAVAYNGYMYVMGGDKTAQSTACSGGITAQYCSDVQYAPISSNGAVGTWNSTTSLPYQISGQTSVAYNGYLYRIGGDWTTDVQYAPINSNGTIGAWITTTSLTSVRYDGAVSVMNGYIYLAGGSGNGGAGGSYGLFSSVQYAPIHANGSLGSWTDTTALSGVRTQNEMVAYNGYLYVLGGTDNNANSASVVYAAVNPAGTTTTYTSLANTFTPGRERHASVAYNGFLYVIGGRQSGTTYYNTTLYARICTGYNSGVGGCGSAAGGVGTWATTTNAFTAARAGHTAVVYHGYLYILGGLKPSTANNTSCRTTGTAGLTCNDVQKALICTGSNSGVGGCNATAGNVGTWTTSGVNAFSTPRSGHTSVVYNDYIYVIGGDTGSLNATTQYAPIDPANGNIGTWNTSANNFTTARSLHASVVYNGYLYIIGGNNGTTQLADTQKALICTGSNSGVGGCGSTVGDIGIWASAGANFSTPRDSLGAVAYNGYVYILGGSTGTQQSIVQYAVINSDGTIGAWVSNTSLNAVRSAAGATVYNGYIYITGGFSGGYSNGVYSAKINNNGAGFVGSSTSTTALTNPSSGSPAGRYSFASVAYKGYLYSIGGDISGIGYSNSIQYALICTGSNSGVGGCGSTPGALGTWTTAANSFSTGRAGLAAAVYNGNLYVVGGRKASVGTSCSSLSSQYCNDVQYAPINNDGSLGSWSSTGSGFPAPRHEHAVAAYGGYLYVLGGDSGSGYLNDVQYAPINANGTIGGWTTASNTFKTVRGGHVGLAYNGYLYVLGGYTGGGLLDDVQYAPINAGGAPGTWNYTASFNMPRESLAGVAQNGYMYISGGVRGGNAYQNDIQYASINANGTIDNWQQGTNFSTARQDHTTAIYGGYLYILGGEITGGTLQSDVQYAQVTAMPMKALYSKVIDLGTNSKVTGINYIGTVPGGTHNINYRMAGSNGVFGTSKSAVAPLVCNDSIGQYIQLFVTLDDSGVGSFPDNTNSNNAKASSLTVDSAPIGTPPDKRLRHGAWFNNEQLQPFENASNPCG